MRCLFIYSFAILIAIFGAVLPTEAGAPDVAKDPMFIGVGPGIAPNFALETNQVMFIQATNGAKAVLQLTSTTRTNAAYRWRYQAPQSLEIKSGSGSVLSAVTNVPTGPGRARSVYGPGHNIRIKAGELILLWQPGKQHHVAIHPAKATFKIMDDAKAFDGPF